MHDDTMVLRTLIDDILAGRRPPPTADEIGRYETILPDGPLQIAEAAELFGLTAHTLRYYERAGLVQVDRAPGGRRRYDQRSLGDLLLVHRLRQSDLSMQQIGEVMTAMRQGPIGAQRAAELMREHAVAVRRRIAELQISLAITEHKVDHLEGTTP
ncbi:MAG: MerR family transcriptional regulator [Propionibacteriales bacterium]|nr:MerR family transcriptional regulator [Propionibacteriales bacterium]